MITALVILLVLCTMRLWFTPLLALLFIVGSVFALVAIGIAYPFLWVASKIEAAYNRNRRLRRFRGKITRIS